MKRKCLYRCPMCGSEERFPMSDLDRQGLRVVTCDNECTDDDGWRTVMKLMEGESDGND